MDPAIIIPVAAALLGSLAGACGSYLANLKMLETRQRREERRVARALQGEIESMIQIVQLRDYATGLRSAAEDFRQGKISPFVVPIGQNYFSVFEAHTAQIGALQGDLPRRVAEVYTLAKALVDDFRGIADKDWESYAKNLKQLPPQLQQTNLQDMAKRFDERANFINEAMKRASDTATQLADTYGAKKQY